MYKPTASCLWLALAGGLLVLVYALWRRDPVFTLGQSVGILVYTRNLVLIHRKQAPDANKATSA